MSKFLLGRKGRMTQIFTEDGVCIPVTIIEAGPCWVTGVRTADRDGYDAVQIGFEEAKPHRLSKCEVGHLAKAGAPTLRHLRENRLDAACDVEVGAQLGSDVFAVGDYVDIAGTTKGRGFGGVMKRHGFGGGRMTHGGMARRRPGAIGACAYPGRVWKGKRMAGHFGAERQTTKGLQVVHVDAEAGIIMVRGAVPGARGGLLEIGVSKTKASAAKAS